MALERRFRNLSNLIDTRGGIFSVTFCVRDTLVVSVYRIHYIVKKLLKCLPVAGLTWPDGLRTLNKI